MTGGKIRLLCWSLQHDLHIMDFSRIDLGVYYNFLSNSVHLLAILMALRNKEYLKENPCFWDS